MKQKITYLNNVKKLCLGLTLALTCFSANAQVTTIFSEDFSSITGGDNTTETGSETAWVTNASFKTAWRTFEAGGALRLGNDTYTGYVTTNKTLDLSANSGNFAVSFDVKGWTTVEDRIVVRITNMETQYVTYTATMKDAFERVTLYYTGGKAKSSLSIETYGKRAFIDNIAITTSPDANLKAPEAISPTDVKTTGFTASWSAVDGATSYLLDVSTDYNFGSYVSGYESLHVTGTSQAVAITTTNSSYYFKVRAVNAAQTSVTSNTMDLFVKCLDMPVATAQGFCAAAAATVKDLKAASADGATLVWYADNSTSDVLADDTSLTSTSYFVSQKNDICETDRVEVAVTIITVTKPEGDASQEFTEGQTLADLTVTVTADKDLAWYTDAALTQPVPATTVLTETTYYAAEQSGACTSEALAVTTKKVLGTSSFNKNNFTLYPNPVKNVVNLTSVQNITSVAVYNVVGQKVVYVLPNATVAQINMQALTAGYYVVTVTAGSQSQSYKVIKQ